MLCMEKRLFSFRATNARLRAEEWREREREKTPGKTIAANELLTLATHPETDTHTHNKR